MAWWDLVNAPGTALLTLLGVAILVFAYLLLAALADTLESFSRSEAPVQNLVIVDGRVLHPEQSQVDLELAAVIEASLGQQVEQVTPVVFRMMRVDEHIVQVRGAALEDWEPVIGLRLLEGHWPAAPGEIAIGAGTSHFTGWERNDELLIYGSSFRVVGILDAPGTKFITVWMSLADAQDLFGRERGAQMMVAKLRPEVDPLAAQDALVEVLADRGSYDVYLEDAILRELSEALEDLSGLTTVITWIAIAAVTLGAYNLTRLAADERRRVLGLLRTVGFSPSTLHYYLLVRMAALACLAYVIALVVAEVYLSELQARETVLIAGSPAPIQIRPEMALGGFVMTLGSALAGTWLSARQVLLSRIADLLGRGPRGVEG